jgi:CRISPR-associated endonuclease/helicase Cas3
MPIHADLWATTAPASLATPDPGLFLHGPSVDADVQIVWRADVDPDAEDTEATNRSLELCPPSTLEAMPVPLWAIRRWLSRQDEEDQPDVADIPEKRPDPMKRLAQDIGSDERLVLRSSDGQWTWIFPREIKPGDMIVAPTSYGGCDEFGWNPGSRNPVPDLGTEAHYLQRRKAAIRITAATLHSALTLATDSDAESSRALWNAVQRLLQESGDPEPDEIRNRLLDFVDLPDAWIRLLKAIGDRMLGIIPYAQNDWSAASVPATERTNGSHALFSDGG